MAIVRNLQDGGVEDILLYEGFWQLNGHVAAPHRLRFFGRGTVETGSGQLQFTASSASPGIEVASGSPGVAQVFGRVAFLAPTNDIAISEVSTLAIHAQVSGPATIRQLPR